MQANESTNSGATNDLTLFQLWRSGSGLNHSGTRSLMAVLLLVGANLSINSIWGLTGSRSTLISGWLRGALPLESWLYSILAVLAVALVWTAVKRHTAGRDLIAILLVYILATWGSRAWQGTVSFPPVNFPFQEISDAFGALYYRSFFLLPLAGLFLVRWLVCSRDVMLPFRIGQQRATTRLFLRKGQRNRWTTVLMRLLLFACLPTAILLQVTVGFEPITSGKAAVFFGPIVLLAFFNAFAEDAIYVGFILPALIPLVGPGRAILLAGLNFGLMHWGAAPDVISGLPQALSIGVFAIIGSKNVVETKGLGLSILVHASVDVALFSAHFI